MTTKAENNGRNMKEGDLAPDFTLPTDNNGEFTLSALRGKNIVLYFYPKDSTPGCTTESKDFRDLADDFKKTDTLIFGVSKDSVKSHDKFKEKYCLPFPLISDEEGKVIETYGVWKEKSMYGKTFMGIERSTFLIDKEGKLNKIWRKVKVNGHAAEVLEASKLLVS